MTISTTGVKKWTGFERDKSQYLSRYLNAYLFSCGPSEKKHFVAETKPFTQRTTMGQFVIFFSTGIRDTVFATGR
jgi:hypothetical protein